MCRFFSALAASLLLVGCAGDQLEYDAAGCANLPQISEAAQAHALVITVFQRVCRRGGPVTTNVSIHSLDSMPTGEGNVFVADDTSDAGKHRRGSPTVFANFKDSTGAEVWYPPQVRVLKRVAAFRGISVTFQLDALDSPRR